MLFVKYCQTQHLSILNTWFDHPIHHRVTWHNPNGINKKVYDYSISRSWLRQFVSDVRVRNSYFHSDHRLVVTNLKTPANRAARQFRRRFHIKRPNLLLLQNENVITTVQCEITDYLNQNNAHQTSIIDLHTHIIEAMENGRKKIPPKIKSLQSIPWDHDEEMAALIYNRRLLRNQNHTNNIKAEIKQLNKQITIKVRNIRNDILKSKAQAINVAKENRQMAKLWKDAKRHDKIIINKPKPIQCPGLASYFKKHFNPDYRNLRIPSEIQDAPEYIQMLRNNNPEINKGPPNQEEILKAVRQLNQGKSSIDIETEILLCASSIPNFLNIFYINTIIAYGLKDKSQNNGELVE